MSEQKSHILLARHAPALDPETGRYLVHTIDASTFQTSADSQVQVQAANPLLVIQAISNQSENQAFADLQRALAINSHPVIGLHFVGSEDHDLVLTESYNINQLDNALVCDLHLDNINEIMRWATQILISPLAAQRLSTLPKKPPQRSLTAKTGSPDVVEDTF